jgi:hypothetical protein
MKPADATKIDPLEPVPVVIRHDRPPKIGDTVAYRYLKTNNEPDEFLSYGILTKVTRRAFHIRSYNCIDFRPNLWSSAMTKDLSRGIEGVVQNPEAIPAALAVETFASPNRANGRKLIRFNDATFAWLGAAPGDYAVIAHSGDAIGKPLCAFQTGPETWVVEMIIKAVTLPAPSSKRSRRHAAVGECLDPACGKHVDGHESVHPSAAAGGAM